MLSNWISMNDAIPNKSNTPYTVVYLSKKRVKKDDGSYTTRFRPMRATAWWIGDTWKFKSPNLIKSADPLRVLFWINHEEVPTYRECMVEYRKLNK